MKGHSQTFGVDCSETFDPISRLDTTRLLLAIATKKGCKIFQLDVKYAFLNVFMWRNLYVDALLVTRNNLEMIDILKE